MQNVRNNLRLIWADKIALTLAVLIVALAAFVWLLAVLAAGLAGASHVFASVGTDGALELAAIVFAVWATFRALDFAFGGSTYRLFHAEPAADAPLLQTGGNLLAH
jgi:hypothetical protein